MGQQSARIIFGSDCQTEAIPAPKCKIFAAPPMTNDFESASGVMMTTLSKQFMFSFTPIFGEEKKKEEEESGPTDGSDDNEKNKPDEETADQQKTNQPPSQPQHTNITIMSSPAECNLFDGEITKQVLQNYNIYVHSINVEHEMSQSPVDVIINLSTGYQDQLNAETVTRTIPANVNGKVVSRENLLDKNPSQNIVTHVLGREHIIKSIPAKQSTSSSRTDKKGHAKSTKAANNEAPATTSNTTAIDVIPSDKQQNNPEDCGYFTNHGGVYWRYDSWFIKLFMCSQEALNKHGYDINLYETPNQNYVAIDVGTAQKLASDLKKHAKGIRYAETDKWTLRLNVPDIYLGTLAQRHKELQPVMPYAVSMNLTVVYYKVPKYPPNSKDDPLSQRVGAGNIIDLNNST